MNHKTFSLPYSNWAITKQISEEDLKPLCRNIRAMTTGYTWYDLSETSFLGQRVVLSLCFYQEKLIEIHLTLLDDKYGRGWDDWSEEKELQRRDDTGTLLQELGYPQGDYEWGKVMAVYSSKTGQASGIIRF